MKQFARLLACTWLVVGCTATSTAGLSGRAFDSQVVTDNGNPRTLVGTQVLTLSFDDRNGVGASAGCNLLGGTYAVDDGKLVLREAATTMKGCDTERHAQDDWYFHFLQSSPTVTIEGDRLTLQGSGVAIQYRVRDEATSAAP